MTKAMFYVGLLYGLGLLTFVWIPVFVYCWEWWKKRLRSSGKEGQDE